MTHLVNGAGGLGRNLNPDPYVLILIQVVHPRILMVIPSPHVQTDVMSWETAQILARQFERLLEASAQSRPLILEESARQALKRAREKETERWREERAEPAILCTPAWWGGRERRHRGAAAADSDDDSD